MPMLTQRSVEKELLDLGPAYYSAPEYEQCLKKLFRVNRIFGFFQDTIKILKNFSANSSVLDIGCGGGLFLLHLSKYFPAMNMLGMDTAAEAIDIAQQELEFWKKIYPNTRVAFELQSQAQPDLAKNQVDIILATLVCHHLTDEQLINFLCCLKTAARKVVIINDLHRHLIAHRLYAILSPVLFRNRLITHDGLISIRRGFTYRDWQALLRKAGIDHFQISWRFPFRWRVILWSQS